MSPEERQGYIAEHEAWFAELAPRGVIAGGEELAYPSRVTTITTRRGEKLVSDGPFLETKDLLGGFIVLDVGSREEAVEIASSWPGLRKEGNTVEVVAGANRQP